MIKSIIKNRHFHFINWYPEWRWISFEYLDIKKNSYAIIYEWCLIIGFIEIRKWRPREKRINKLNVKREYLNM